MLSVLTNPDAFYKNRVDDPSLLQALGVIALVAVLGAISSYVTLDKMFAGMPDETAAFGTIAVVFAVITGVVGPFVIWGIYSVVFYVISLAFDGEGSLRTLAAFTAFGYVPSILNGLIGVVLTYFMFQSIQAPTSPQAAARFQSQLQAEPLFQLSILIGVVFSLWRAFIWAFAVKHARDLTLKQSGIVVGIPVAVGILFTVGTNFL